MGKPVGYKPNDSILRWKQNFGIPIPVGITRNEVSESLLVPARLEPEFLFHDPVSDNLKHWILALIFMDPFSRLSRI